MPGLGLSYGGGSSAEATTTATANTTQQARARGGGAKVTTNIVGDAPGTVPTWLLVAAVLLVFLVVVGLLFASL